MRGGRRRDHAEFSIPGSSRQIILRLRRRTGQGCDVHHTLPLGALGLHRGLVPSVEHPPALSRSRVARRRSLRYVNLQKPLPGKWGGRGMALSGRRLRERREGHHGGNEAQVRCAKRNLYFRTGPQLRAEHGPIRRSSVGPVACPGQNIAQQKMGQSLSNLWSRNSLCQRRPVSKELQNLCMGLAGGICRSHSAPDERRVGAIERRRRIARAGQPALAAGDRATEPANRRGRGETIAAARWILASAAADGEFLPTGQVAALTPQDPVV